MGKLRLEGKLSQKELEAVLKNFLQESNEPRTFKQGKGIK